jgi:hypothetical protein
MLYRLQLVLVFSLEFLLVQGQEMNSTFIDNMVEMQVAISETSSESSTDLYENIQYYLEYPLNINLASSTEFYSSKLFSPMQLLALQKHIQLNGPLLSIYELQTIPFFDNQSIKFLLPLVTVKAGEKTKWSFKNIAKNSSHSLMLRTYRRFENKEGQITLGDPYKTYGRYRFNFENKLKIGFTVEKDPGEENFLDYESKYIEVNDLGLIKTLVLGDFDANFGQGMALWTGFGMSKAMNENSLVKTENRLFGHSSAREYNFFKGAGVAFNLNKITPTLFYSKRKLDARIENDSTSNKVVKTIYKTGLHRMESEVQSQNTLVEKVYGSNLSYDSRIFHLGITGVQTNYSLPIDPDIQPYSKYRFSGIQNNLVSTDFTATLGMALFFGEYSRNTTSGEGYLLGFLAALNQNTSYGMVYRNYNQELYLLYANSLRESTEASNENGIYQLLTYNFSRKWKATLSYDYFQYPWLTFNADVPSYGIESQFRVDYSPSYDLSLYVRYTNKNSLETQSSPGTNEETYFNKRSTFRTEIAYPISYRLKAKNRIEFSWDENDNSGFLFYQDIRYTYKKLTLDFRYLSFSISSFDSRIYAYERDVLYVNSIPFYSGNGQKVIALAGYKLGQNLKFWLKASQLITDSTEEVNWENPLVKKNRRSELTLQLQVKFN